MWRVGEYARTEARPPPPSQQQSDGGGGGGNRSAKKGRPQVGVGTEGRCRPFLFPALFFSRYASVRKEEREKTK